MDRRKLRVMVNKRQCYLCGSTEFNKRQGSVRDMPKLGIFECSSCGLVFLSSFEHVKNGFYESSKMHGEEIPDIQAWLKETDVDDQRRFQYLKSVLPNRKLLDFGCGAGGFLLRARELATAVFGIEAESRLKNHFQDNNLTVFQSLSDIPENIRKEKYDIITMFHALEHLPEPKSVLSRLSKMLTENGQIIIEVPNASDA